LPKKSAEVGNVEPTNGGPNGPMLLQNRPILDGHVPSPEVDEASTEAGMEFVKR
jgi:hypothetical protein